MTLIMNTKAFHSKIGAGSNPFPGNVALKCSCSACDSIACFAKRQLKKNCSCDECPPFGTKYYINNISKFSLEDKPSIELVKNDITYDYDKVDGLKKKDTIEKQSQVLFSANLKNSSLEIAVVKDNNGEGISVSNCPRKKASAVTAQLSAQIMDVPYEHFEGSYKRPEPLPNLPKLSPLDIFQKIKEVYKACSCKVCDCIVGNLQRNEFCKCKPCDCDDCTSYNRKIIKRSSNIVQNISEPVEFVYARCDMPYICRAVKEITSQQCDCRPCECIKCSNSVSQLCDCEPCQCIECRMKNIKLHQRPKSLVVAAVGDDAQTRRPCQCTPCECIDCGQNVASPTPVRHEMSTGLNRHPHCRCDACNNDACLPDGSVNCRCERLNKIIRKPVTKDYNEYDIRTAMIHRNIMHVARDRRDAITMFAAINNNYPNCDTTRNKCKCDPCECLSCIYEDDTTKESVNSSINNSKIANFNYAIDECKLENEYCDKKMAKVQPSMAKWCKCDECNCINCNKVVKSTNNITLKTRISNMSQKTNCCCSPCECTNCERVTSSRCTGDIGQCAKCKSCTTNNLSKVICTMKKGEQFIRQTFENQQRNLNTEFPADVAHDDEHYLKSKLKPSIIKKQQKINMRIEKVKEKLLDMEESQDITAKVRNINKGSIDLQKSPSVLSANSSASYYIKDSGSVSPLSGCRNKSWESSCNSSGHDNPNYLVQFPKNTVDTCLNDVMKLNLQSNYSAEKLNITTNERRIKSMKEAINESPNLSKFNKYTPACARPIKHHVKMEKLSYDECSCIDSKSLCSDLAGISNNKDYSDKIMNAVRIENHCVLKKYDKGRLIDYNKYFEDSENEFCKESYPNRKYRKLGQLSINNDFLLDEDYERVQKTLEDAREFSQQLTKLLEKYEKANRDFVRISQKLKYPNYCKNISALNTKNVITEFMEGKVINTANNYSDDNVPTKENINDIEANVVSLRGDENKNVNKTNSCADKIVIQFKKDKLKDLTLNNKEYENCENKNRLNHEENLNPIIEGKEPTLEGSSIRQRVKKSKSKRYNKMYKRAVNVLMKPKICVSITALRTITVPNSLISQEYSNNVNQSSKYQAEKETNSNVHQLIENNNGVDTILETSFNKPGDLVAVKSIRDQNVPAPDDKVIRMLKPPAKLMHIKNIEKSQQWSIMKENCSYCIHSERQMEMKGIGTNSLEIDIKNKMKSISWDSKQDSNSLDDLKVTLLRVRRVSDHTVMVKWNAPRTFEYVDGYEVLLDGRAVQKNLNASRCMTIITCLPNVDQLLLTVRTITNYKCKAGHGPASTIIYRPRVKPQFDLGLFGF